MLRYRAGAWCRSDCNSPSVPASRKSQRKLPQRVLGYRGFPLRVYHEWLTSILLECVESPRGGPRARAGCWNDTHVRGRPDHHGRSAGQGHRHSAKEPHQPRRSRARTIAGARVCRRALGHSEGARELPTAGAQSTMPRAPRAHRCSTRRLSRGLMSTVVPKECSGSINAAQCSPSVRHRVQQQTARTAPSAAVTSAEIAPFHRLHRPPVSTSRNDVFETLRAAPSLPAIFTQDPLVPRVVRWLEKNKATPLHPIRERYCLTRVPTQSHNAIPRSHPVWARALFESTPVTKCSRKD